MSAFRLTQLVVVCLGMIMLSGCIPPQPKQQDDICQIFQQYPEWYWDAKKTQDKWDIPIAVQMSIMHTESEFLGTAEPIEKKRFAKVIHFERLSSAYGYCQALRDTWQCYEKSQGALVSRDQFAAASDFIGWYSSQAKQIAGIQPTDAYDLYLAYHEGLGGYHAKSYWRKPWLVHLAHQVQARADIYARQLQECESQIPKASILQSSQR